MVVLDGTRKRPGATVRCVPAASRGLAGSCRRVSRGRFWRCVHVKAHTAHEQMLLSFDVRHKSSHFLAARILSLEWSRFHPAALSIANRCGAPHRPDRTPTAALHCGLASARGCPQASRRTVGAPRGRPSTPADWQQLMPPCCGSRCAQSGTALPERVGSPRPSKEAPCDLDSHIRHVSAARLPPPISGHPSFLSSNSIWRRRSGWKMF